MSNREVQTDVLVEMFTKGFMQGKNNNKKPDYILDTANNVRVRNGGICPRLGYEQLYVGAGNGVRAMIGNDNNGLYYAHDSKLKSLNITTGVETNHGSIGTDVRPGMLVYGKYTMVLTGVGYPWVFDGITLTQLTSANIIVNANPSFGVRYAGFTVVNDNRDAKNVIHISRPITQAVQTNAYMWDDLSASGSQSITYDTEVLGLESSTSYMWVFTKNSIEKMTKDNLTTSGGLTALYTLPIARGQEVLNNDCIVSAGDIVLFVTAKMQVGTLEYQQSNVTDPTFTIISNITDRGLDIQERIDGLASPEIQKTSAFGLFNEAENCVYWGLKSKSSPVVDKFLIYDITNSTFYTDTNKYFSCGAKYKSNYYGGGAFSGDVFHDYYGRNDLGVGITCTIVAEMIFKTLHRKKLVGEMQGGAINYPTLINHTIECDDDLVFSEQILGTNYIEGEYGLGIGGNMVGGEMIGGNFGEGANTLSPFNYIITESKLPMAKGMRFKHTRIGEQIDQDWVLDYFEYSIKALRGNELKYKA